MADAAATNEGTPLVIDAADLLVNDYDADTGDELVVIGAGNATQRRGRVRRHRPVKITFTPADGFAGQATFEYTISDGHGGEATGAVVVTVNAVPVAVADTAPYERRQPAGNRRSADLLANDTDGGKRHARGNLG